jgi:hypothetical protein
MIFRITPPRGSLASSSGRRRRSPGPGFARRLEALENAEPSFTSKTSIE